MNQINKKDILILLVFWNIWGHHNFLLRLPDLYKVNVVFNLLNGPLSNEVATLVAICLLPPAPSPVALCSWKHVWNKPCVPKYVRQTFELALLVSCTKCYSTSSSSLGKQIMLLQIFCSTSWLNKRLHSAGNDLLFLECRNIFS